MKNMSREHDCRALLSTFVEELRELFLGDRIEARRGFVEYDDARAVHERLYDPHLLSIAFRQTGDTSGEIESKALRQTVDLVVAAQPAKAREKFQVSPHRHVGG